MKTTKPLFFLAMAILFISGCLRDAGDSAMITPIPTPTAAPGTEHTSIPGEPVPWNELVFYNMFQVNYVENWEEDQPRLSVISDQEEIASVEKWIRTEHLSLIRNIDYSEALVLIIFSGWRGENRQGIEIDQLVKNGDEITLSVSFTRPAEGEARGQIITSPYRIIKISRADLPENPIFILIANGEEIDRVTPGLSFSIPSKVTAKQVDVHNYMRGQ